MIIHHYFPITRNSGDFFVRAGIRMLIGSRHPGARFVDLPVNGARDLHENFGLRPPLLDATNAEADLVVVGGSNLYEGPAYGWDWGVSTDADSIRALNKPLVLMGIGTGSRFGRDVPRLTERARDEIVALNRRATASSVRDPITRDFLVSLGVENATLTGCPAMFVGDVPLGPPRSDRVVIGFPPVRFAKKEAVWKPLVAAVRAAVKSARGLRLEPVLLCHNDLDVPVAKGLFWGWRRLEIVHGDDWEAHQATIASAGAVVAFRLHAAILACGFGVPFVLMRLDKRHEGFEHLLGLEEWTIRPDEEALPTALADRLRRTFKDGPAMDYDAVEMRKRDLNDRMQRFLDQALGPKRATPIPCKG